MIYDFKMFFENYARQEHLQDFLDFVEKFLENDIDSDAMIWHTIHNARLWHKLHGPTMWDVAYNHGKDNHGKDRKLKHNFKGKLIKSIPHIEGSNQNMKANIKLDGEKNQWHITIPSIKKDGFISLEDGKNYFVFVNDPHDYYGNIYANTLKPFKDFMDDLNLTNNINIFFKILHSQIQIFFSVEDQRLQYFKSFAELLMAHDIAPIYIEWLENHDFTKPSHNVLRKFLEELLPTLIQLQGIG